MLAGLHHSRGDAVITMDADLQHPPALLEECSRVLGPGGRVLFIVPNRTGLWSRFEGTPFGHGRPYTARQLELLVRRHGFTPERHVSALYFPPSQQRFWMRTAGFWERVGRRVSPMLSGGVLIIEASKQVYAPTRPGLAAAVRRPLRVLEGGGQPVPEMGRKGEMSARGLRSICPRIDAALALILAAGDCQASRVQTPPPVIGLPPKAGFVARLCNQ